MVDTYFFGIGTFVVDTLFVLVVVEIRMVGCDIVVVALRKQKLKLENGRVGNWNWVLERFVVYVVIVS